MKVNYMRTVLVLFFFFLTCLSEASTVSNNDLYITLKVRQKTFKEVAELITKQTNYKLQFDDEAARMLVSGNFVSVTVENFLNRVFNNNNIFVIRDDANKIIKVQQAASLTGTLTKNRYNSDSGKDTVFGSNLTVEELDNISQQNAQIYKESKLNPEEKIFGSTLRKYQLDAIGQRNKEIYDNERSDPDSIILGTDLHKSDIQAVGRKNFKIYETMKNNPNLKILGSNMTVAELNVLSNTNNRQDNLSTNK